MGHLSKKRRKKLRQVFRRSGKYQNPVLHLSAFVWNIVNNPFRGIPRSWAVMWINDPCVYCGNSSEEWEHLDAVANGGNKKSAANLARACKRCNRHKSGRSVLLFLAAQANRRKRGLTTLW